MLLNCTGTMNFYKFINSDKSKYSEYEKQLFNCNNISVSKIDNQKHPIYKATINPELKRSVYLIGCIHGNEIAGTTGILNYLQKNQFPKNIRVEIIPILNSNGFIANTRNNKNDIDINRDMCNTYKQSETMSIMNLLKNDNPEMLWTLHEDNSCDEFYTYYSNHDLLHLWKNLTKLAGKYFPILNGEIHGDICNNGLIRHPEKNILNKKPKHKCSIENAFYNNGIHYLTTETPSNYRLSKRTLCYTKMINYILNFLDEN